MINYDTVQTRVDWTGGAVIMILSDLAPPVHHASQSILIGILRACRVFHVWVVPRCSRKFKELTRMICRKYFNIFFKETMCVHCLNKLSRDGIQLVELEYRMASEMLELENYLRDHPFKDLRDKGS